MEQIFIQLAIILLTAFVFSYFARLLKQPIIIGYILSGIIISPFILVFGASAEIINVFSKFGIAFLLFIVGLHLKPKTIKEIGISSVLIGLAQIIFTFFVAFIISLKLLNLDVISSAYIGIALAFSSTIIVMKLFSDKQDLDSLYAKISIGILIIQDIVAIAVLVFISSLSGGASFSKFALGGILGGAGLLLLLLLFGFFVLPKLVKNIAKSQELLFLFSVCWCFVIAGLFNYFGFSIEIGALIAGVILSISPYSVEISSKMRPLRDFFIIIFFIILGLNTEFGNLGLILVGALVFSIIVLILKPIIIMAFMALFKYTKRTNFLVGTTLAQVSEFSLVILLLGVSTGHINSEILHTVILTMIITILLSTYMIIYSEKFYLKMSKFASLFERRDIKVEKKIKEDYDAILFGYNRIGFSILNSFKKTNKRYLVVDFNPETISNLTKLRIPSLYGDVDDSEFLHELPLEKLKIIVSTIPEFDTNILLLEIVRRVNKNAIIILRAHTIDDALEFYKKGASYVLTPHFLGGEYVSHLINELKSDEKGYEKEKEKHIAMLKEAARKGQEHPKVES